MKRIIFAALAMFAISAHAQQSYHLENSGRISNSVSTYAAVNGGGTSVSHAEGAAQAIAAGSVVNLPGTVGVTGHVEGYNTASAFNVSTGNGIGSAGSVGWSDATVRGHSVSVLPFGNVNVAGTVDGGMLNPVRNGTDVNVIATTSQDGFVNAEYKGGFSVSGSISQSNIPGGKAVYGVVQDTKYGDGKVVAGGITFTDGTPAGQSAAVRFGNAGVEVKVDGSFYDPVGN